MSHNDGKSWDIDNTATLYKWEDQPDMGYPVSLELSPGKIITVFYCSRRNAEGVDSPFPPWPQNQKLGSSPEGLIGVYFNIKD